MAPGLYLGVLPVMRGGDGTLSFEGPGEAVDWVIQSIYGFRDADVQCSTKRPFVAALRPDGDPRRAISVSFRARPEILSFVNDLFAAIDKAPDRADAFRYGDSDRFPLVDARSGSRRPADGGREDSRAGRDAGRPHRRRHRDSGGRSRRRPRSCGCSARRCAIARPACGGRRSRPTSRSSSARATAIASSRRRSNGAASRPTSTRGSGSSTPTKFRTSWRCCGIWPIRCRICAPRRSCGRGSCGCRTRRSPRWRRDLAAAICSAPSRRRARGRLSRRGSARAGAAARGGAALAVAGSIG